MERLTGNKQTDFLILKKLTDYELTRVCQVNKYVNSLCQDDTFWLNRILKNYPLTVDDIKRIKITLEFTSHKELYIWLNESYPVIQNADTLIPAINESLIVNNKVIDMLSKKKFPDWINKEKFLVFLWRNLFIYRFTKRNLKNIITHEIGKYIISQITEDDLNEIFGK